jgi:hypothetical protein
MILIGSHLPLGKVFELAEVSYTKKTICVNEVECLVQEIDGHQVIAFRGTEADKLISGGGWRDVLRDLRAAPWYDKRVGWSHAGFLKGARGIVDKGLFGLLRREKPIVITGHSLGGALAINAAAMLDYEGFKVVNVVTFGSPRTLIKSSTKRFAKNNIIVQQFSNAGDPVPDVPFRWWGYRHVNEITTSRIADGYSASKNHLLKFYKAICDV